jgi:hypothetical protein
VASTGSPISQRKRDWFFVACFAFFAFSSFYSDACYTVYGVDGDDRCVEANQAYSEWTGDRLFAAGPAFLRTRTFFTAFVFGPFHLLLVYAFVAGANWIQKPALLYVGAITVGMCEHLAWEWVLGLPPRRPAALLAFNLPYLVVPLLLGVRMWRAEPFGASRGSA